jgi:hypothetical protein
LQEIEKEGKGKKGYEIERRGIPFLGVVVLVKAKRRQPLLLEASPVQPQS